ncbi:MAG: hypothetical protein B0W54_00670 [Cellvibrio sp. 79]|nr:MAG: hypothetical protein B0W54_00670 [Cellvibrio sp. 79]
MIKNLFFGLAFLGLSLTASAGVVTIEYSGTVSNHSNGGWGPDIGTQVGGVITIDLSKSSGKVWENSNSIGHYAFSSNGMVTSSGNTGTVTTGTDFVDVYDNSYQGSNQDYLWLNENISYDSFWTSSGYAWKYTGIQLGILFQGLNWITNLSLDNLNINTADPALLNSSFGVFTYGSHRTDLNGNVIFSDTRSTLFKFDSLKITSPLVNVPESGSVALLLMGMLGVILRRRVV